MNRLLTLIAASACAAIAVSSACFAAEPIRIGFSIDRASVERVPLTLITHFKGGRSGNWNQTLVLSEFQGLTAAQLNARAATPVRFAIARRAGRLDCTGTTRNSGGRGDCGFTADPGFASWLSQRGIRRPTAQEAFVLAMTDFRPETLDALLAAGFPRPSVDNLVALGIFDIEPGYVRDLAAAGYRLTDYDDLVGFKIHKVSPALIAAYRGLGYKQLDADDLMAMSIHGVTPDFIRSFAAIGYRDLTADQLVQLKIFNVTPQYVRSLEAGGTRLSTDDLVASKIFGGIGRRARHDR